MKQFTDIDYIHRLISEGEHQQQDFKFEISDARKIAKTLSAFANTSGGRLLIGVKDNGKIAGVRSSEERFMVEAAAQLYCWPAIDVTMQTYIVDGKAVLVAQVDESSEKPVYAKDTEGKRWAYVRVKDETILATSVHLQVWRQENRPGGELTEYTVRERQLLSRLEQGGALSLGKCCRLTRLPRRMVEQLLARFVRYGLVEPVFEEHTFHFRLK